MYVEKNDFSMAMFIGMLWILGSVVMFLILAHSIDNKTEEINALEDQVSQLQMDLVAQDFLADATFDSACEAVFMDGTEIYANAAATEPANLLYTTHGDKLSAFGRVFSAEKDWVQVGVPAIPASSKIILTLGWVPFDRVVGFNPAGCEATLSSVVN